MLWKILSGISALCLAAGLYFSYEMQGTLKQEREMADRSKQYTTSVQQEFAKVTEGKEKHTQALAEATKQLEDLKEKVVTATTDVADKTKEAEVVNLNLTEIKKQVADLEKQIEEHGDIQKLLSEVKLLTEEKSASDAAVANKQQQMAIADERVVSVQKQLQSQRESEASQNRGVLSPSFTARISQAFPDFGFVILNKGNQGGLVANANLDVRRGGNTIASLKVRDVEQAMAIADIVPGSMSQQNLVRAGDTVAASRVAPPPAPVTSTPPPADPSAPAADPNGAAPGMAADPFAPAPGTAPAPATDPFAPATAPAAGATDPFAPAPGGAPAPAPAATPDPFAPPAGTTPAPAAPADPFAPAPAM